MDQVVKDRDDRGNIANDQLVRAVIEQNIAARTKELLQRRRHRGSLGITQYASHGHRSDCFGLRLFQIALGLGFLLQSGPRRDPQDVAVELFVQAVILHHDIERLIPRHFIQYDGERPLDRWIQYPVQAADFMNQAEEILQAYVLQVYGASPSPTSTPRARS